MNYIEDDNSTHLRSEAMTKRKTLNRQLLCIIVPTFATLFQKCRLSIFLFPFEKKITYSSFGVSCCVASYLGLEFGLCYHNFLSDFMDGFKKVISLTLMRFFYFICEV
ncbi:hypothetical protein EYC84_001362 [Monilinia fructicola]|uniref:Uncharacterized protein n=1 Tax=Monilinia fructicola TaxID=38448 RepID=A0A5M9JN07_MONFR|nr:hypothetical protein EYC84_001362 [Monilinia fructicola]